MTYETIFFAGRPPAEGGHPPVQPRTERAGGILIERDVAVPLRDGAHLYADVYRPDAPEPVPPIISWSPYGKHSPVGYEIFPGAGVRPEWLTEHAGFEAPDPGYWAAHGYAVVSVDPRGTWCSPGDATFWSPGEAEDCSDVIEWAGTQPWSNGRVGMSGVSYLAMVQWRVAALRPPHLAAINPWEGVTDLYREMTHHGGIPETRFLPMWQSRRVPYSTGRVEDLVAMGRAHPLLDEFWESKMPDLARVEVPAYVVASWSDQGLHTRGTLEGFRRIGSAQKWLWVHGRKKWEQYYQPENVERLRRFFDHFLRGVDSGVESWPRVRLEVRDVYYVGEDRSFAEWPVAPAERRRLFLDAASGTLLGSPVAPVSSLVYDAATGQAVFDHVFGEAVELIGPMRLRLWVEAPEADDMDLFVAVRKLDRAGEAMGFPFFNAFDDGPVALGWLRASHRELDEERSTLDRPWHPHRRERRLTPGEAVPVEIEVWPSATRFAAGEGLRLVVQGRDVHRPEPPLVAMGHEPNRNAGRHVLRTGGPFDAYLQAPVAPS